MDMELKLLAGLREFCKLLASASIHGLLRRRRSAAAIVPPTKPTRLIEAVPCEKGAPVTGFVLAQATDIAPKQPVLRCSATSIQVAGHVLLCYGFCHAFFSVGRLSGYPIAFV